jgi:hypothetical protein
MDEAIHTVHEAPERANTGQALADYPATIMTLAKLGAIKAVKRDIKARGEKLAYFDQSDIVTTARQYLSNHPELIEEAAETVQNVSQLRTLALREARERRRKQR